jgi:hypothetical protein
MVAVGVSKGVAESGVSECDAARRWQGNGRLTIAADGEVHHNPAVAVERVAARIIRVSSNKLKHIAIAFALAEPGEREEIRTSPLRKRHGCKLAIDASHNRELINTSEVGHGHRWCSLLVVAKKERSLRVSVEPDDVAESDDTSRRRRRGS